MAQMKTGICAMNHEMRYPATSWNIAVNDPLETQPIYLKTDTELFDKQEVIGTWGGTRPLLFETVKQGNWLAGCR